MKYKLNLYIFEIIWNILINFPFKADVYGSIEALLEMFSTFDSQLCELRVVHHEVGPVTEADVNLAESLNGRSDWKSIHM